MIEQGYLPRNNAFQPLYTNYLRKYEDSDFISADVDVLVALIQIIGFLSIGARRKSVQEERIFSTIFGMGNILFCGFSFYCLGAKPF